MTKILIVNGTQPYDFAPGRLNATLTDRARSLLTSLGHEVRVTTIDEGYDVQAEVDNLGRHRHNAVSGQLDGRALDVQEIHG